MVKSRRKRFRYTLVYYLIRSLIVISNLLPRKLWLMICGGLGRLAYRLAGKTRELTILHLGLAFGKEMTMKEIVTLSKQVFVKVVKNGGDVLRAKSVKSPGELDRFLKMKGYENFEKAYAKGKGVIFMGSHLGAFDLSVGAIGLRGWQPHVIGTPLKDERLNKLMYNYRSKNGAIPVERGRETFKLLKVLKSGGMTALLIDQDTKVKSCFVDFFGMKAATPVGPAALALKTGAAVVPFYNYLGEDGYQHMELLPEVDLEITGNEEHDITVNTQKFTHLIESWIRQYPDQWVWWHERWKTKAPQE